MAGERGDTPSESEFRPPSADPPPAPPLTGRGGAWGKSVAQASGKARFRAEKKQRAASRAVGERESLWPALRPEAPKRVCSDRCSRENPSLRSSGKPQTSELKRTLGKWNLLLLGVGCIIGAGIFVRTGSAAALHAGPAVLLSFVVAGHRLRLRGPVLRRAVLDPAGLGIGLYLQLHDARRVRRLDHGRAAAPRIRPRRLGGRGRLGRLCGQPAGRFRARHTARS